MSLKGASVAFDTSTCGAAQRPQATDNQSLSPAIGCTVVVGIGLSAFATRRWEASVEITEFFVGEQLHGSQPKSTIDD